MSISKETYQFNHAFRHMVNAKLHLESIVNDGIVKQRAKQLINKLKNRIDVNISDILTIIPKESAKILQDGMLDSDITLQIQHINDMCVELPTGIRNQVESYVEHLYRVCEQKK